MARKITTETFISEMKEKYGDKYDYSKVDYVSASKNKVIIICPKHGEFKVLPSNFRKGCGCPKCSEEEITQQNFLKFLDKAKLKFGDKYDYSKVNYTTSKNKVTIICPTHGEILITPENHLISKTGCPKCSRENIETTFGKRRSKMREYSIWKGMKTRVTNPNTDDSSRYIDRGITCCEEWLNSFEAFYRDMGECPEGYSLDRINNDLGYFPENCRWASKTTQSRNRGEFNKLFTYNNETHVLKEWAEILNIKYTTLYNRIYRSNLSFEEAIQEDPFNRLIELDSEKHTLKEWSVIKNIPYKTLINRIHKHNWTYEKALQTPYKQKI